MPSPLDVAKGGCFITGIGTGVGKTWTSAAMLGHARARGIKAAGMKPVASGCEWRGGEWRNADAELLLAHSMPGLSYRRLNRYAFARAVSPHIACGEEKVEAPLILQDYAAVRRQAEWVLVEGAGGWFSPLGPDLDNAGLAAALGLPVIVVVGLYLGCINHARLTLAAVWQSGLDCAGWVAVELSPAWPEADQTLVYLRAALPPPLLARLPFSPQADFNDLALEFAD